MKGNVKVIETLNSPGCLSYPVSKDFTHQGYSHRRSPLDRTRGLVIMLTGCTEGKTMFEGFSIGVDLDLPAVLLPFLSPGVSSTRIRRWASVIASAP